jgi:hypothetical protein
MSMCLIAGTAQAEKLSVVAFTSPSHTMVTGKCELDAPSHLKLFISAEDGSSFTTRTYPGSVSLMISGGVPPYQIIWHEHPWVSITHMSAMPGVHRVTVVDAEGTRVNATALVTSISSYDPAPCRLVWRRELIDSPLEKARLASANEALAAKKVPSTVDRDPVQDRREIARDRDERPEPDRRGLWDASRDRHDPQPEPNGPRDPDHGVVNSRPVDRVGNSGTRGTPIERTGHTLAR